MSHRGRSTADDLIACALASGKTHKDAATESGVSEKTVFRRVADPVFAARVREMRGAMVSAAAGKLADGMAKAADVLVALLQSESEPVRLRAADRLIELCVKVTELAELQARVEEIERQLTTQGA